MRKLLIVLLFATPAFAQEEPTTHAAAPTATVTWQDMSANETGFLIERQCTGEAAFVEVGRVGANVVTFVNTLDASALGGKTCAYRAAAFNASGQSAYSNVDSCVVPAAVLEAPQNLRVAQ